MKQEEYSTLTGEDHYLIAARAVSEDSYCK
jgi:hypothetical protein